MHNCIPLFSKEWGGAGCNRISVVKNTTPNVFDHLTIFSYPENL